MARGRTLTALKPLRPLHIASSRRIAKEKGHPPLGCPFDNYQLIERTYDAAGAGAGGGGSGAGAGASGAAIAAA
jgi:hypothetical protein